MANISAGEWNYIGTIAVPPSTGQVRLDAASQTAATHVWINKTTAMSTDASAVLAAIVKGQDLSIYNKSDPTKGQVYTVTGNPVDGGTYFDYPVVWKSSATNGAFPAQRTIIEVVSLPLSVAVTGLALQPSSGLPTLITARGIAIAISGQSVQSSAGWTTFRGQGVTVPVSGPQPAQISAGTTTFREDQRIEIAIACLTMKVGPLDVSGQLVTHDYFHPFEGLHLTSPGLTIRQWYAGQALTGFIANSQRPAANLIGKVADYCFKVADSMIAYEAKQAAGTLTPPAGGRPNPPVAPPPSIAAPGPATVTDAQVAALRKKDAANAA
jgi:hypothetical protein